jgi:hypothetical protein
MRVHIVARGGFLQRSASLDISTIRENAARSSIRCLVGLALRMLPDGQSGTYLHTAPRATGGTCHLQT